MSKQMGNEPGRGGWRLATVPLAALVALIATAHCRAQGILRLAPRTLPLLQQTSTRPANRPTTRPVMLNTLISYPPVSLHGKELSPADALAQLSRKTGVTIRVSPTNLWQSREWPKIDLDLEGVSFWRAMKEICVKSGLQFSGWDRDVMVMNGTGRFGLLGDGPTSDTGITAGVAHRLFRVHTADLHTGEIQRQCTVSLTFYLDPRIRILSNGQAELESALDERGRDLTPPNAATAERTISISSSMMWQIAQSIGVTLPVDAGSSIAVLKGYLPATVASEIRTIEIPEPLTTKGFKEDVGPWRLEVSQARELRPGQQPKTYQVEVLLQPREGQKIETGFDLARLVQMVDGKGAALMRQRNYEVVRAQPEAQQRVTIIFTQRAYGGEALEAPAKLLVDVPVQIRETGLPFEFQNIPLP